MLGALLFVNQFPANISVKAEEDWSEYLSSSTHVGDPNAALGSWPVPGPGIVDIWGIQAGMENVCLCL